MSFLVITEYINRQRSVSEEEFQKYTLISNCLLPNNYRNREFKTQELLKRLQEHLNFVCFSPKISHFCNLTSETFHYMVLSELG